MAMKLTTEQMDLADLLFQERDERTVNRDWNLDEIDKLRLLLKKERDMGTKYEIRKSIVYGNEMIEKQKRYIRARSIAKIADKIGAEHHRVAYYERSSYILRL